MTVAELIVLLQGLPQDAPVMMAFPSAAYWNTHAVGPIGYAVHGAVLFNKALGVHATDDDGELLADSPVILGVAS